MFYTLPFQGQYYDAEIELAYNRFRYYDPEDGRYISQDPIGLASGEPNFYAYVEDTNTWVDVFGLAKNNYTKNREAFRQAKHDANVPVSAQPFKVNKVRMTDKNGNAILNGNNKPIITTEYHFINNKGQEIVIQNHSAGHQFPGGVGNQGSHYNVRPANNTRTGNVEGTQPHYNF